MVVLVAGTVATVVTPFGPSVWAYAIGIGADPQIAAQVSEWQRTTPFTVPGLLFYVSAVAALGVAVWRRARLSLADWLWLGALLVIGAWAVRGIAWWPLGAVLVDRRGAARGAGGSMLVLRLVAPTGSTLPSWA